MDSVGKVCDYRGQFEVHKCYLGGACNLFVYTVHVSCIHSTCNDELYNPFVNEVKIYRLNPVLYFDVIGYVSWCD